MTSCFPAASSARWSGQGWCSIEADPAKQRIIDVFNKRAEGIIANMALVAPKKDGLAELFPYLMDVFWLDLGQLLYILDRAEIRFQDAFQPVKHITFSSRDFWTEVAHVDRGGLAKGKWRPLNRSKNRTFTASVGLGGIIGQGNARNRGQRIRWRT